MGREGRHRSVRSDQTVFRGAATANKRVWYGGNAGVPQMPRVRHKPPASLSRRARCCTPRAQGVQGRGASARSITDRNICRQRGGHRKCVCSNQPRGEVRSAAAARVNGRVWKARGAVRGTRYRAVRVCAWGKSPPPRKGYVSVPSFSSDHNWLIDRDLWGGEMSTSCRYRTKMGIRCGVGKLILKGKGNVQSSGVGNVLSSR